LLISGAGRAALKHIFQISTSVEHADDADRPNRRIIDDKVREHRPELHWLVRKVFTAMSGLGIQGKKPEFLADFAKYISGESSAAFV
jgi:hypothetical protein